MVRAVELFPFVVLRSSESFLSDVRISVYSLSDSSVTVGMTRSENG
jgi:hypothetical protein